MADRYVSCALFAVASGIAAIAVGAITLANMGDHLALLDNRIVNPAGRSLLIAAEIAEVAAFSIAATLCLALASHTALRRWCAITAFIFKLVVFVGLLAGYWRLWYFMLDLRGPDGLSLVVIILSGLQVVALAFLVTAAGKRRLGNAGTA